MELAPTLTVVTIFRLNKCSYTIPVFISNVEKECSTGIFTTSLLNREMLLAIEPESETEFPELISLRKASPEGLSDTDKSGLNL